MLTSPSCRCCSCSVLADASLPASTCSGTFTGSSGNTIWTTIAGNALRMHNNNSAAGKPWRASVSAMATPSGMFGIASLRLVVGSDCDNFVFLERGNSQSRLGKKIAGVESFLAFAPHVAGAVAPFTTPTPLSLSMCWDGVTLTGGGMATRDVIVPGARIGYGVTTFTGMTSVSFSNVLLELSESDSRPNCEPCVEHCCKGPVPAAMELEISNVDPEVVELDPGHPGDCESDCVDLNGTRVLPARSGFSFSTAATDAACNWNLNDVNATTLTCITAPPPFPPSILAGDLQFFAFITSVGDIRRIEVQIFAGGTPNIPFNRLAVLYAETDDPCIDFTSWINLTVDTLRSKCSMLGVGRIFRIRKV